MCLVVVGVQLNVYVVWFLRVRLLIVALVICVVPSYIFTVNGPASVVPMLLIWLLLLVLVC